MPTVAPEDGIAEVGRRHGSDLRRAGEQLCASGAAELELDGRSVEARLVRFWRGDSLLEISTRGPDRHGATRTRIPRDPPPDLLVGYLARGARG